MIMEVEDNAERERAVTIWQGSITERQKRGLGTHSLGFRAGALFSLPAELVGTSGDSIRS